MVLRVDKFLGCLRLDRGGIFIAWIILLASLVASVTSCILIWTTYNRTTWVMEGSLSWFLACCFSMYVFCTSIQLISGIKKRESKKVQPALIILSYSMVFTVCSVFTVQEMVIVLLFQIYFNIILYSLWRNFQEEEKLATTVTSNFPVPTISVVPAEPTFNVHNQNMAQVHLPNIYAMSSAPPRYEKV